MRSRGAGWRLAASFLCCLLSTVYERVVGKMVSVDSAQGLWRAVQAGERDIVLQAHLDLRYAAFDPPGEDNRLAVVSLLALRNSTRSLRVRLDIESCLCW